MTTEREYKKGDIVHVRAVVYNTDPNMPLTADVKIRSPYNEGSTYNCRVLASEIVHVEPRPLKVGDVVRARASVVGATIIATEGEYAWVKFKDGERATYQLSDLRRVE